MKTEENIVFFRFFLPRKCVFFQKTYPYLADKPISQYFFQDNHVKIFFPKCLHLKKKCIFSRKVKKKIQKNKLIC